MDYNQIKNLLFHKSIIENDANNNLIVTSDHVFLPNELTFAIYPNTDFASSNEYFLDECPASDYAIANNVYVYANHNVNGWSSDCTYHNSNTNLSGANYTINSENHKIYNQPISSYNSLKPCIVLDLNFIRKNCPELLDRIDLTNGTLKFGEFPQTHVPYSDTEKILHETNLYFIPSYLAHGVHGRSKGIVPRLYNKTTKETYVQCIPKVFSVNPHEEYENGEEINTSKTTLFKAEPIEWKIINHDYSKPLDLNSMNYLVLTTSKFIFPAIPYYVDASTDDMNIDKSNPNCRLWQNSLIRAYLNGYDIKKEITENKNGNPDYLANANFDYSRRGENFIDQALKGELVAIMDRINGKTDNPTTPITENNTMKAIRKKYGVTVENKPMSISEQMEYYINNGRAFMLHGKSGIGKSRRIQDIDPTFVSLTLRNGILPEEVIGKDFTDEHGISRWTPPSFYNRLVELCEQEPDKNHVLFLDEITNVNEHEQSLAYDIVLNHTIKPNFGRLPNNCVVVAAGNAKDESEAAYNMPEPLFRRFHGHIYLPLDVPSFLEWGSELRKDTGNPNIHPIVARYIATYPKQFYSEYDPEKEGENFAIDPRAWEQISDIIYDNNGSIQQELIENKIGRENAILFTTFAQSNIIDIEDVLQDNFSAADIPTKIDEQYAIVLALRHATEEELPKVRKFIEDYLSGEALAKFDYIWVNRDVDRALILKDVKEGALAYNESLGIENTTRKEAIKFQPPIHINEFFGSQESNTRKAIHCDNAVKAQWLCRAFDRLGKTWKSSGEPESYGDINKYEVYGENTCYTNDGDIIDLSTGAQENTEYYEFDDISFDGILTKKEIEHSKGIQSKKEKKKSYSNNSLHIRDFVGDKSKWNSLRPRIETKEIYVYSEEEAHILAVALNKMGLTWHNGESYINNHPSSIYYTNTGYSNQSANRVDNEGFIRKIYSFSDIDFSGVLTPTEIREIHELYKNNYELSQLNKANIVKNHEDHDLLSN